MWTIEDHDGHKIYAPDGSYLGSVYGGALFPSRNAAFHVDDLIELGFTNTDEPEAPAEDEVDAVQDDD